jgi:hypothetical protein
MNPIKGIQNAALYLIFLNLLLAGCEKENGTGLLSNDKSDSTSSSYTFQQISFLVSLHDLKYGYANLDKIDSIKVNVDGKYWGTFSSQIHDTSGITLLTTDNLGYSEFKIDYLIIAPYQSTMDQFHTVGDFINNSSELTPGDHVCEVSEVKFKNFAGHWIEIKPQIFKEFRVIENTTSSFVGEIEIPIR